MLSVMQKIMNKQQVFIAVPAFGQQNFTLMTSALMALAKALLANGWDYYFTCQSFTGIDELRNMLSTIWYDRTQAEFMLQIDADMAFEPALILEMLEFNKAVVGAAYPQKKLETKFVMRLKKDGQEVGNHIEIDMIGAGILLIRRDCMKALLDSGEARSDHRLAFHTSREKLEQLGCDRIIRAFDKIELEHGILSEDYSFCHRVKNVGVEMWANIGHNVSHVGPHVFTACFKDARAAQEKMLAQSRI